MTRYLKMGKFSFSGGKLFMANYDNTFRKEKEHAIECPNCRSIDCNIGTDGWARCDNCGASFYDEQGGGE